MKKYKRLFNENNTMAIFYDNIESRITDFRHKLNSTEKRNVFNYLSGIKIPSNFNFDKSYIKGSFSYKFIEDILDNLYTRNII